MPRPRAFDEADTLQCAMLTFWRLGYDATTLRVLEKETGVGLRSLHNTFGEKDELFARSLEMYRGMASDILAQVFAEPGVDAIVMLFEGMATRPEDAGDIRNSGCLVVNSVFELPEMAPQVAEQVEAYRAMFREQFLAALTADGIDDPENKAEFLLGALWGALSQVRLARDTAAARPMVDVTVQTIRAWMR